MTRLECHELALLYARLIDEGDPAAPAVLTALHGRPDVAPAPELPPHPPMPPRTRSKMTPEERREWEAARKREQRAAKSSATNGATSGATSSATKSGTAWDIQKGSQTLQKAEEKRNLSDFRAVVSEIEVVEKSGSSEFRARPSATFSATNGATTGHGTAWDSGTPDVSRRDALRVQRRFVDALGVTWDTHSWLSELQRIACKPEADIAKVLANLQADAWVKDNRGVVTPGHLLKHWDRYLQPPKGRTAKPVDETPVIRRYVNHDAERAYREQMSGKVKYGAPHEFSEPVSIDKLLKGVGHG